jgi:hypothetical protein
MSASIPGNVAAGNDGTVLRRGEGVSLHEPTIQGACSRKYLRKFLRARLSEPL